jgi:NagD protein
MVVVGDDPALEMRMANAAGALAVGLTTGLMQSTTDLPGRDAPAVLLDGLEPVLAALG